MNIRLYVRRLIQYVRYGTPQTIINTNISSVSFTSLLSGRLALITGGSSGIGFSIAEAFLRSGADVFLTGRDCVRLELAVRRLRELYPRSKVYSKSFDIRDVELFPSVISDVSIMSGRQVDILVNNAGIEGGHISTCSEKEFSDIINTNIKGAFFLSELIAQEMIKNNIQGNILNVVSSSGIRPAVSAYMISKWGLRGLTLGLAKRFIKNGIVVNGIAPGPTATSMQHVLQTSNKSLPSNPSLRYVEPEEVANAAVFLVSSMGRMVVGDILYMTGGAGVITMDDVEY